jgi:hypothetical protein
MIRGGMGGGEAGGGEERSGKKHANAGAAHESVPQMWVMHASYPGTMCSDFDALQQCKKFLQIQAHRGEFGSGSWNKSLRCVFGYRRGVDEP